MQSVQHVISIIFHLTSVSANTCIIWLLYFAELLIILLIINARKFNFKNVLRVKLYTSVARLRFIFIDHNPLNIKCSNSSTYLRTKKKLGLSEAVKENRNSANNLNNLWSIDLFIILYLCWHSLKSEDENVNMVEGDLEDEILSWLK
jgi:hypothetical protein